ncbi:hypothetical protein [Aeromonas sp. s4]|uniref:hypothetical protein n=1 Tax=Aeromonas sp. s4 TaxID=3138486 RepID=UPI0034A1C08E
MLELMPKIADISSIKGISKLLSLPMVCVAYMLQSGAVISLDSFVILSIPSDISAFAQLNRLILIFILKSLFISTATLIIYEMLKAIHIFTNKPILHVISMLFIAFAILGIFGLEHFPQISAINPFWFYSFIVWGIYIQTTVDKFDLIDEEFRKTP